MIVSGFRIIYPLHICCSLLQSIMSRCIKFPPTVLNHGCSTQPASTSVYQALTQALASMSQSLEEILRDFIKMAGQSINDVRSTTMVNTYAIAKLEMQKGQLANHLGERDKGKLPSQPVANPKAFTCTRRQHIRSNRQFVCGTWRRSLVV